MKRANYSRLVLGLLLVLVGIWFLLVQWNPQLGEWMRFELTWPLIVIGVGIFLFLFGLLVGEPGMSVPACIVAGIGGILYWQNSSGDWGSWSYAWTLIPGFVGVGILLSGLIEGKIRKALNDAGGLIIFSLLAFLIFGSWFGGLPLGEYWPVLLILLGLWVLVKAVFRQKKQQVE